MTQNFPVVLAFSGHDPSGGAGVQADIEAVTGVGSHIATVITALTVQDTQQVDKIYPTDAAVIKEQAKAILEDMPVKAFKLGLLGSLENIEAVHEIIHQYRDIPVIMDPIVRSGTGSVLADDEMTLAYSDLLFPLTKIVTPNSNEAINFAPESDNLQSCAQELMDDGCEYVLITGTHSATEDVINTLYHQHKIIEEYRWPRLPHDYHGSGCTLASSLAGYIAQGFSIKEAVIASQQYTWDSLNQGVQLGMGQMHPFRQVKIHGRPDTKIHGHTWLS
ncbi:MAG: hydroxymethylpyrimidine/phosphomethylpyrimidine kinase [Gammaproteobacteria bacterium]|nr:hydroxymethylpyrimidine/phosphomethylpyrimidine kinase [Gammaproteobacteria bacterium]